MIWRVDKIVSAIVDTLVDEIYAPASADGRDMAKVYVLQTVDKMPDYFRIGFQCLTLFFGLWSVLRHGRMFHRLKPEKRRLQILCWRRARLGFPRSMMAFYTTFTAFGLNAILSEQHRPTTEVLEV